MRKKVRVSPLAEADLIEIALHISSQNISAADKFLEAVNHKFHLIGHHPELGRLRPELRSNVRSLPIMGYVVFYDTGSVDILVVRILHGHRDIESLF